VTDPQPAPGEPADAAPAGRAGRARRPRRQRSVTESLLSVALGTEAFVMLFVALTANGLRVLPTWLALGGGALFIVLLVLVAGLLRHRWAVWAGWVLQAALVATGFLMPAMFVVAAIFVGLWIYCFVKARQIERARTQHAAAS
jgi:hypothetical protein